MRGVGRICIGISSTWEEMAQSQISAKPQLSGQNRLKKSIEMAKIRGATKYLPPLQNEDHGLDLGKD